MLYLCRSSLITHCCRPITYLYRALHLRRLVCSFVATSLDLVSCSQVVTAGHPCLHHQLLLSEPIIWLFAEQLLVVCSRSASRFCGPFVVVVVLSIFSSSFAACGLVRSFHRCPRGSSTWDESATPISLSWWVCSCSRGDELHCPRIWCLVCSYSVRFGSNLVQPTIWFA